MTKEHLANLIGRFTWDFGMYFFIETEEGNFVWSDPDYHGTGEIVAYPHSYKKWINGSFGRDKGKHIIGQYCGDFTFNE